MNELTIKTSSEEGVSLECSQIPKETKKYILTTTAILDMEEETVVSSSKEITIQTIPVSSFDILRESGDIVTSLNFPEETRMNFSFRFGPSSANLPIKGVYLKSSITSQHYEVTDLSVNGFALNVRIGDFWMNDSMVLTFVAYDEYNNQVETSLGLSTSFSLKSFSDFSLSMISDEGWDDLDEAGAAVIDRYGDIYPGDTWNGNNDDALGVAFSNGSHRFYIEKKDYARGEKKVLQTYTGGYGVYLEGYPFFSGSYDRNIHTQTDGRLRSEIIASQIKSSDGYFTTSPYSIAAAVKEDTGGYIGSIQEMLMTCETPGIYERTNALLEKCGGRAYTPTQYHTSNYYGDRTGTGYYVIGVGTFSFSLGNKVEVILTSRSALMFTRVFHELPQKKKPVSEIVFQSRGTKSVLIDIQGDSSWNIPLASITASWKNPSRSFSYKINDFDNIEISCKSLSSQESNELRVILTDKSGKNSIKTIVVKNGEPSDVTTIRIDQNLQDPEKMITLLGSDYAIDYIRSESHRYISKKSGGKLLLSQLSDENSIYYHGTSTVASISSEDVFVKIPEFWWTLEETSGDVWELSVSLSEKEGWNHWTGQRLIGAYKGFLEGNYLYSRSSVRMSTNFPKDTLKTSALARGLGYDIISWQDHCILGLLWYLWYRNPNSQDILPTLYLGQSLETGKTNSYGMEDTCEPENSISFWGIEDCYGTIGEFLGDTTVSSGSFKVEGSPDVDITEVLGDGNIRKMVFGKNGWLLPKEIDQEDNLYDTSYSDRSSLRTGIVYRSGSGSRSDIGINFLASTTGTNTNIGTRLIYYGPQEIVDYESFNN